MSTTPDRYAPRRAFPAHAFVPGRTARRPKRERDAPEIVIAFGPEHWRADEDYLFGADLYNAGFLWEAHEAWERPWFASQNELQRLHLQALIQCAAACLKLEMGEPAGAAALARQSIAKLERVARAAPSEFMGLDVAAFARALRAFFEAEPATSSARPRLVLRTRAESRRPPLA